MIGPFKYHYLFQLMNNCLAYCWIHLRIWGLGAAASLPPIVKNARIPTRRHKLGQDFLKYETPLGGLSGTLR